MLGRRERWTAHGRSLARSKSILPIRCSKRLTKRSDHCSGKAENRSRNPVADQAAVTDTHPLVYHAAGGRQLGKRAAAFYKKCERRQAIIYVPTAVIWECSLLARVGRIHLRRSVRAFFDDLFSNPAYQPLDLSPEHVFLADETRFNRD